MPFDAEKLATLVNQGGIVGILIVVIGALATKRLVLWWTYDELQKERDKLRMDYDRLNARIDGVVADRDNWREVAFNATALARTGQNVARRATGLANATSDLVQRLEATEAELSRQRLA